VKPRAGTLPGVGTVAVVTDSSTCLPSELAERYGVEVLAISAYPTSDPLRAAEGDGQQELSDALEQEELASAHRPFVTEYLAAVEAFAYDAAVVVTPALEFASMYRNASVAVQLATRPAVVIDARTAAAGQALVVLAGAEVAAEGGDLAAVVAAVEDATRRVELVASLATLEPLRRNGPIPDDVLGAPQLKGSRSLFRMHDGTIEPLGEAEDADGALQSIVRAYHASTPHGAVRTVVFHAGAPDLAHDLDRLLDGVDFVTGFSGAMQVHTGPGVVGAAWLPRTAP